MGTRPIVFDAGKVAAAQASIPATDFVDAQFDVHHAVKATDALIVMSTPRSGSTLLCELLRLNRICIPHEYFQPGQYLPLLATRWHCVDGATLNEASYVAELLRHRTYANGWLGINLHGSHLPIFARMTGYFTSLRSHYVHLLRRDLIPQAVSYHVAAETRQWSSAYASAQTVEYSFSGIEKRLQKIQSQNVLIHSYLIAHGASAVTVYYEDLVQNLDRTLRLIPGVPPDQQLTVTATLQRQSGSRSAEWAKRFAEEYWNMAGLGSPAPSRSLFRDLQRFVRRRTHG